MACLLQVEVAFSDVGEKGANAKSENTSTQTKVLPPWMIKKGMVLTDEQRGEVKRESTMEGASAAAGLSDDKKSIDQKDEKNLQVSLVIFFALSSYIKFSLGSSH